MHPNHGDQGEVLILRIDREIVLYGRGGDPGVHYLRPAAAPAGFSHEVSENKSDLRIDR